MNLAVGSDEKTVLTDFVVEELKRRGHAIVLFGPLKGETVGWPDVGEKIGIEVSSGRADQGIVFCWTGTGVTIAANKVPGARAALCWDAETAKGARMWDDANVLAMSLRSTSTAVAREILNAWFSSDPIKTGVDAELIQRAKKLDSKYLRSASSKNSLRSTKTSRPMYMLGVGGRALWFSGDDKASIRRPTGWFPILAHLNGFVTTFSMVGFGLGYYLDS